MAKKPLAPVLPIKKTTPATIRKTFAMSVSPNETDAPLSQQPAVRKRLGAKLSKI